MTLSSLRSAKCSGLSEGERGRTSPAGELRHRSHRGNGVSSVRIRKNRVRSSNNLYGSYSVQTSKIRTIKRLILLKCAVQVRTSTDRTGCTNFFREKMHFLRAGVDKRLDAYKTTHPAPTGQGDVMCCTRDPKVGTLVFFCFLPEYTENFAERAKKRQNCNGKRKKPLPVAGLQQQGRRESHILNKTAERIIMRKKFKNEKKVQKGGPTIWHRNICPHHPTSVLRT